MPPSTIIDLAGLAGLLTVVWKLVDFVRLLTNLPATTRQVVTQLLAWAAGVGVAFLYASSQYGHTTVISGVSLDTANAATLILVGIAVGSAAGAAVTVVQAIDNTQTAAAPPLRVPGSSPVAPVAPPAPPVPAPPAPPGPTVTTTPAARRRAPRR